MKIAFVLDTMIYGGIERVAIDYMNILLIQGHQVDVFILNPKVEAIVKEIPTNCNIRYVNFSKKLCSEMYWIIAKSYKWGKFIFPIIYFILVCLTPVLKLFKGSCKKYDVAIAFSGHYNDLTYISKYIKADKRLCWLHGGLSGYILISTGFGHLYNKIKNLVVLSEDGQEEALLCNKWIKCNITKLYNPIFIKDRLQDGQKIERLKRQYGDFLLMVGRFSSQKDHYTVIEAIKILKNKYKKKNICIFVGDGPDRKKVEKYAFDCGVSDLIIFTGTQSDVQNYYRASKIFVHSSPAEGLPTVLLEAMSFGVPIVATDSKPGVREILGDNEYGLICPIKNAEIMADKINMFLSYDKIYLNYVKKGYERIKDFDPKGISQQLEKLLNEMEGEN